MAWKEDDACSDAVAGVGLGSGQEVLGPDTSSGDSSCVVGLETPRWYSRVGWESSQVQERPAGLWGAQCALYAPWDRAPFRARLAPPGEVFHTRSRTVCPVLLW